MLNLERKKETERKYRLTHVELVRAKNRRAQKKLYDSDPQKAIQRVIKSQHYHKEVKRLLNISID